MISSEKTVVTGANGFLGRALLKELRDRGFDPVGVVRSIKLVSKSMPSLVYHSVGNIDGETRWGTVLQGADVVIHCAARVHVMNEDAASPLQAFRSVNRDGTLNLARQAAALGVRRFIFVSSVKVNGEHTDDRGAFGVDEQPAPEDAYGCSKREAEDGLRKLAQETGMEVVIIRPPLIYGPGVKGNFRKLLTLAKLPLPLPFGAVRNRRSMIYVGNLVDVIILATEHPAAANQTFLVSDGEDISTTALLASLRKACQRNPRLVPIPPRLLRLAGTLTGKQSLVQRLCGSLQVDITKTRRELGWSPPYDIYKGLTETVRADLNC